MSMKSKLGAYAMFAAMAAMGSNPTPNRRRVKSKEEKEAENKKRLAEAEIERKKSNGLKEFFYGENSLFALNQKSADKKARKLNWIK